MVNPTTSLPTLENLCIANLPFNMGNAIELLTPDFYWVCISGDRWSCSLKYKIETLFYRCFEGASLLYSTHF